MKLKLIVIQIHAAERLGSKGTDVGFILTNENIIFVNFSDLKLKPSSFLLQRTNACDMSQFPERLELSLLD